MCAIQRSIPIESRYCIPSYFTSSHQCFSALPALGALLHASILAQAAWAVIARCVALVAISRFSRSAIYAPDRARCAPAHAADVCGRLLRLPPRGHNGISLGRTPIACEPAACRHAFDKLPAQMSQLCAALESPCKDALRVHRVHHIVHITATVAAFVASPSGVASAGRRRSR